MNEDIINQTTSEELISVPSFLSSIYAVSTTASCSGCQVPCMAEQEDPCGTGEACSECSCQGWEGCSESCSQSCSQSSGCSQSSSGDGGTTLEDPTFRTSQTTTSVSIRVTDSGDYSYFSYSLRDANDNIISSATKYSTSKSKTYSGLSPNTDYIIVVSWSTSTTGMGNYEYYYVTTDRLTVAKWNWNASNGSATATQTQAAYAAIINKTSTSNFSYKVWNDMVDKVVDVWHAQGGYFNTEICSYEETLMYPTDKVLTAKRFNSLRRNIGLNYSTDISNKNSGDPVFGEYFITLADCLNGWIDNI